MKKRTTFIGAILSLVPFGKTLLIKTGVILSTIGISISNTEKIYAFPIDYHSSNTCSGYLYKGGESKIEPTEEGLKIVITTEVKVESDYREDVIKAISKADAKAKIFIYRLISAELEETKTYDDNGNLISKKIYKHKGKMSDIENSMRKLNGIMKIGECYQPYKFVRVTFGIKPETVKHFESNPK